jgi:micrococcal nuclease
MKSSVAAIVLSLPISAFAYQVVNISDGETLTLLVDDKPVKVKLAGIDAPEKRQAFGRDARASLADLCLGKDATFRTQDTDSYGTQVAVVFCNGVEVNRAQIERGMAWVFDRTNRDFTLPALQMMAKRDRKGLWADANPVAPWDFRRPQVRRATSAPSAAQSDPAICFVDRRGEYRYVNGAKRYGC